MMFTTSQATSRGRRVTRPATSRPTPNNPAEEGALAHPAGVEAVRQVMADGQWHTIADISDRTGFKATGAAARIRDLRKPEHGAHVVSRRATGDRSIYEYRLEVA